MTTECIQCKLPEHDQEYYSWKFVTPYELSQEIRALDTPDAWDTADHVYSIHPNGEISHSKGRLATGSSEFIFAPPIPGLRLDIGHMVTFAADFSDEKKKALYKRLAQAVCLEILTRSDDLSGVQYKNERTVHMLVSGNKFKNANVVKTLQRDDEMFRNWTVSASENTDSKKRKVDESEKKETE